MAKRRKLLIAIANLYGASSRPEIKQFARKVGASEAALIKWIYCRRRPRYVTMQKIERLTAGAMKVGDW